MAFKHIMGESSYLAQKTYASADFSQVEFDGNGGDGDDGLYQARV